MTSVHLRAASKAGSEIYHYRLYSVPDVLSQVTTFIRAGMLVRDAYAKAGRMQTHLDLLAQNGVATSAPFSETSIKEQDGRQFSIDGEMLQGSPSFNNFKLTLFPDAVFLPLVTAIRELNTEVWLEITCEQAVTDCPPLKAGEMYWPRKERLYFWGKLLKNDSSGAVDRETRKLTSAQYSKTVIDHAGTLDMTFVHWMKVRGAQTASYWLDQVKATVLLPVGTLPTDPHLPDNDPNALGIIPIAAGDPSIASYQFVRASTLLYKLVQQLSPTALFAMADQRLTNFTLNQPETPASVAQGALQIALGKLTNGTFSTDTLDQIWIPIRMVTYYETDGTFDYYLVGNSPLFESPARDGSIGPMSLYNIKDLAEAIVRLPEEFFFKWGVELPTLDDVATAPAQRNGRADAYERQRLWQACSRWLFQPVEQPTSKIYSLSPDEKTIKYNPAAQWLTGATYDMPTPNNTGPAHWAYITGADEDLKNDYAGKLLFRFTAYFFTNLTSIQYQQSGVELWIGPDDMSLVDIEEYSGVQGFLPNDDSAFFGSAIDWALAHAYFMVLRWGHCRAQIEFDNYGRAIEPFGASSTRLAIKPKRTFGLGDIGDFPLLRSFTMQTGLLPVLTYTVQEITMTPKKPTHIKAIEITPPKTSGAGGAINQAETPYVPVHKTTIVTHITKPTGGSITGVQSIQATITPGFYPVASVKVAIDGVFLDYAEAMTANADGTSSYAFSWNTGPLAHTMHTITVTAFDTAGNSGSDTKTVTTY